MAFKISTRSLSHPDPNFNQKLSPSMHSASTLAQSAKQIVSSPQISAQSTKSS